MKNTDTLLYAIGIPLVIIACVALTVVRFEIYKKKHGEQMTFTDFMLDSERK